MIQIIENNYKHEDNSNVTYKVICPNCKSVLRYSLDDLDYIEKSINGKRPLTCPCCGIQFDTSKENVVEESVANGSLIKEEEPYLTKEEFSDKYCKPCTSHVCSGVYSEAAFGCWKLIENNNREPNKQQSMIGMIGRVTAKPTGKFRMPFYTGEINGKQVIFVTEYDKNEPKNNILNVGEEFIVTGSRGTADGTLIFVKPYNRED